MTDSENPTPEQDQLDNYNAARDFFESTYEREHPRPTRRIAARRGLWERGLYLALTLASIIVGASHTIPMVLGHSPKSAYDWLLAGCIVTMLELALVMSAFREVLSEMGHSDVLGRQAILHRSTKRLRYNVYFTFMVLLCVQIFYMLNARKVISDGYDVYNALNLIVSLMIALAPPVQGWFFGEVFATLLAETAILQSDFDSLYEHQLEEYESKMFASWTSRKGRLGVSGLSTQSKQTNQTRQTKQTGGRRANPKFEKALVYIMENPEALDQNPRELSGVIGVGKDTIYKAQQEYRLQHGMSLDSKLTDDTQPAAAIEDEENEDG